MKNKNGITLIALIITIIIMLILVGVTINFALNGGIINKAKQASIQTEIAIIQEQLMLKKAEIIADNMGDVPENGYGLSSISDLDGLSTEIISKYNSKLTISPDGTLYYLENQVTNEEKVYFENAGITSSQGQTSTQNNIEYYVTTFQVQGTFEQVFAVDYDNATITVYRGEPNSNLNQVIILDDFEFSNESFDIYLDNVRTTITDGTSMSIDGLIGAYKQGNRLYFGEEDENDLSSFSSDQYATLVPNFDTTRLVETEEATAKAYGDPNTILFIIMPDNHLYAANTNTLVDVTAEGTSIEDHTFSEFSAPYNTDPSYVTASGFTVVTLDTSETYTFIMRNGTPSYVYDEENDLWYGIESSAYITVVSNNSLNLTPYNGDISSYLSQIEAMNNGD